MEASPELERCMRFGNVLSLLKIDLIGIGVFEVEVIVLSRGWDEGVGREPTFPDRSLRGTSSL